MTSDDDHDIDVDDDDDGQRRRATMTTTTMSDDDDPRRGLGPDAAAFPVEGQRLSRGGEKHTAAGRPCDDLGGGGDGAHESGRGRAPREQRDGCEDDVETRKRHVPSMRRIGRMHGIRCPSAFWRAGGRCWPRRVINISPKANPHSCAMGFDQGRAAANRTSQISHPWRAGRRSHGGRPGERRTGRQTRATAPIAQPSTTCECECDADVRRSEASCPPSALALQSDQAQPACHT